MVIRWISYTKKGCFFGCPAISLLDIFFIYFFYKFIQAVYTFAKSREALDPNCSSETLDHAARSSLTAGA